MNNILEILKYTIPAIIVFLTAYFIILNFLKNETKKQISNNLNEQKKNLLSIKQENQKIITPIRLQAYERIILLLERISPNNIILRVYKPNMTVFEFQRELINTIHQEFNHNLSQQLYISIQGWELVNKAKEELISLINNSAEKAGKEKNGAELSRMILQGYFKNNPTSINIAVNFLKKEIQQLF
ncbi:MAG: hypothetical protein J7J86_06015 [Bacteroidales bacterium]|nr:hypothetical protein [Bacteroidales bacterium]